MNKENNKQNNHLSVLSFCFFLNHKKGIYWRKTQRKEVVFFYFSYTIVSLKVIKIIQQIKLQNLVEKENRSVCFFFLLFCSFLLLLFRITYCSNISFFCCFINQTIWSVCWNLIFKTKYVFIKRFTVNRKFSFSSVENL